MNRRQLFVVLGGSLTVGSVGCLQRKEEREGDTVTNDRTDVCQATNGKDDMIQYDSYVFKNDDGLIKDGFVDQENPGDANRFELLVAKDEMEASLHIDQLTDTNDQKKAREFIENTDFNDQSLLVWSVLLTHGYELTITDINYSEDGDLQVAVCDYNTLEDDEMGILADYHHNMLLRVAVPNDPQKAILNHTSTSETYVAE